MSLVLGDESRESRENGDLENLEITIGQLIASKLAFQLLVAMMNRDTESG
ncbi:MAG: hypothetical protein U9M89_03245 [Patescibacteria group bacterium]|nr:hypothetical protein [Patescibacteria group bacterium]